METIKKLFAVLVVLAICSAANATTIAFVDEGTTLVATPGDVIRLDIEQVPTSPGLVGLDVVVTVTGGDRITKAMGLTYDPGNPNAYGWDEVSFPIDPMVCWPGPLFEIGGKTSGCNTYQIVAYVEVNYTGGLQVVSLAAGTVFGGSTDCSFGTVNVSTGTVTIVPEPMTIVLLGLGAVRLRSRQVLMLRRKR